MIGAVALWGRVVEHEWGYRADRVADAYGIPVVSAEEIVGSVGGPGA